MTILFTFLMLIYCALLAFLTCLFARKHLWTMSLIRFGILVVSVVVSVLLAKTIASSLGDTVFGLIFPAGSSMDELFETVPLTAESIRVIVALLIAPLLFFFLFVLIRLTLSLLAIILEKNIPALNIKEKESRPEHDKAIATGIGIANGLLIAIVTLLPLCGTMTLLHHTSNAFFDESAAKDTQLMHRLVAESDGTSLDDVENLGDDLGANPVATVVSFVGSPVYTWLTTDDLNDGTIHFNLENELCHLAKTAGDVICAVEVMQDEDYDGDNGEVLYRAADTLFVSDWVAVMASDTVAAMADRWKQGDTFMNMGAPQVPAVVQPTMLVIYDVLSTENAENIKGDVRTVLEMLSALIANNFLNGNVEMQELLSSLAGEDGLYNQLIDMLESNDHLAVLVDEIDALTARVVSGVLSSELLDNPRYETVLSSVTVSLNEVLTMTDEEREEGVRTAVRAAFEEEGIVIPEDVAVDMSEEMLDELGADGEITDEEVKEYLSTRLESDDETIRQIVESNDLTAFISQYTGS